MRTAAPTPRALLLPLALAAGGAMVVVFALLGALLSAGGGQGCGTSAVELASPGAGETVGASEYGGPGDPSSGVFGSSGADLLREPDSYAELGGTTFGTATALGGLPYGTPLRITWGARSTIAYKRDIGFGGGPVAGYPRAIDLWWQLAGRLGIPYEGGEWSGPVRIEHPPATGAGNALSQSVQALEPTASTGSPGGSPGTPGSPGGSPGTPGSPGSACATPAGAGVAVAAGERAVLLSGGQAAAPAGAPLPVKAMIAAGNQIAGRPYVYGGGHGLPLSVLAPAYDCSSSVDHLLWGAGLLSVTDTATSGALESFGLPGPGRWVTLYANAEHVFMYVAGLRWDTWNAAGPQDGPPGIGWHPLVRSADGFVARHPVGL